MTNFTPDTEILQGIFENSPQVILVVDKDEVISQANVAACDFFAFAKAELVGLKLDAIFPKSDTAIKDRKRVWIHKKDGSQALIDLQVKTLLTTDAIATILYIKDTTDSMIYKWALQENKDDLLNAQSDGNIGNWYWVFNTDERYWSDEFYRICGLPPGDTRLNAETALMFIHPDDREEAKNAVTKAIKKHITYNIEKRIIQPDGTLRNVVARGKVDYNKKGEPVRMSGTMKDITDLKNKQIALIESNRKYQTLINNLNGIVYSCDNNLHYAMNFISDGCYALTGYTSDEFLNGSIQFGDIILDEDRVYAWNEIQKALLQKTHFDIQYRIECKKGTIKYVREIGCGVYTDNEIALEGFITDQTESKKTRDILDIRNRALEAAGSGIVIADALKPDLPIIYCNQYFTKMTGYEKAEVIGKNCRFLQNNDKDQPQIKKMSIAIQEGTSCQVTLRNYRKDGSQFWNDLTITPVKNKTGKVSHYIGVQNDITEQKNADFLKDDTNEILKLITENNELTIIGDKIIETIETQIPESVAIISLFNSKTNEFKSLAESKEVRSLIKNLNETKDFRLKQLHPALGSIKEIIITNISDHDNWIKCNDFVEKVGIKSCWSFPILSSNKDFLGLLTLYNTDDKKIKKATKATLVSLIKLLNLAIGKHQISRILKLKEQQLEAYAHSLEGKVQKRTEELVNTVEQLVTSNLSLEDQIKETQIAEKIAFASKSLSQAIAKNFPNGFIIVFNVDFDILFKEGEAMRLLRLDNVISEGMHVDDIPIFSKEEKERLKEQIIKTVKGKHLNTEITYKKKHFAVNTTPLLDENNIITSALFVYNDITAQKKVERKAKDALFKEKELNELKSRFISMASHEFRTPLSAIQTSAILIAKQNEVGKEEKRQKYVNQIKNNVKNLVVILNDFLSLSKLEEGKIKARRELFDFVDFSKTLIKEMSISKKVGQDIIFSSSIDELFIRLDPKLVRHILLNLVSNAIKYSPENSKIYFKIEENDQFVSLEIQDEGIGIPKDEQGKLFERFFRAKNVSNIEGTGLGLTIVKQYVELMDGHIDFKSQTNEGTTFFVKWAKQTIKNEILIL